MQVEKTKKTQNGSFLFKTIPDWISAENSSVIGAQIVSQKSENSFKPDKYSILTY